MSRPLSGDQIELDIERLVAGGDGVGRWDGLAVFVPLTAPGDRVRVRVREVRPRFARGELLELVRPGPGRRTSPCALFGRCGGCSWLHLDPATQREARVAILHDALLRIGKLEAIPPIEWLESLRSVGYRSRARACVSRGAVGFRARGSHAVVDVAHCAVLDAPTQRALERLRSEVAGSEVATQAGDREVELRGFGSFAAGLRVSRGAFFQANGALWEEFAALVAECCGEGERLLELYAGVGFFTARLAGRFRSIVGVERGSAARDLRRNTNASVFRMAAERFVAERMQDFGPEVVLLNPPRSGCHKSVVEGLRTASSVRRIVYVSCDPATLARDLARIAPVFQVTRISCVDAMPQTHHVEAVVVLDRRP